jgi:cell division protein FtsZ
MSLSISLPDSIDMKPKISVLGIGGAGGNAVNNMISSNLEGVEFWVANTDAQALEHSLTSNRIQLGTIATRGLGAGSHPEVGKAAAEESMSEIIAALENANMVFITAGMGGGTGTGAAPVIAKIAKDKGILTVGVVTKPFHFEGVRRMKMAELGLEEMQKYVDTLIVIPNQNLFRIANEKTTFADAFKMADNVLHSGVRGVTDLITMPGLINLDFADIRTVMSEMGKAMMGTGEADGENRAIKAAEAAISNPLLDNSSMKGARGVLINITGGADMTLFEVDEAANRIREEVDADANIIFGSAFNSELEGKLRVSVVATGIDIEHFKRVKPVVEQIQPQKESAPQKITPVFAGSMAFEDEFKSQQTAETSTQKSSFIPPKPVDPEEDIMLDDRQFEHEEAVELQEEIEEKVEQPQAAENQKSFSLFSKVTAGFSAKPEQPTNKPAPSKEDFFDIPAFLRRKGNE